jgi:hypothetical protein
VGLEQPLDLGEFRFAADETCWWDAQITQSRVERS